jgi:hypothetical protein
MPVETEPEIAAAARSLIHKGVGTVIVTLGARGALRATPTAARRIEPVPVTPVDTTSAGDAFVSSFAATSPGSPLGGRVASGGAPRGRLGHSTRRSEGLCVGCGVPAFLRKPGWARRPRIEVIAMRVLRRLRPATP